MCGSGSTSGDSELILILIDTVLGPVLPALEGRFSGMASGTSLGLGSALGSALVLCPDCLLLSFILFTG